MVSSAVKTIETTLGHCGEGKILSFVVGHSGAERNEKGHVHYSSQLLNIIF